MGITDRDIIRLACTGHLRLAKDGSVQKWHRGYGRYVTLPREARHSRQPTRFDYRLRLGNTTDGTLRRRTIPAARLVWMLWHLCPVPQGYDVDHANRNHGDDRPSNLRLRTVAANRSDNGHDGLGAEAFAYFERLAFLNT